MKLGERNSEHNGFEWQCRSKVKGSEHVKRRDEKVIFRS